MKVTLIIALLSVFSSSVLAGCDFENFRCCITEFLRFVSPSGITLTEKNVNSSCTVRNETIECLEYFEEKCLNEDNDFAKTINETKAYVDEMCRPESNFMLGVKRNENCFQNSSTNFENCLNKKRVPESIGEDEKSHWNEICCEYKNLRNCATEAVESTCDVQASEFISQGILHTHGAGLETMCGDDVDHCSNSAPNREFPIVVLIILYSAVAFSVALL